MHRSRTLAAFSMAVAFIKVGHRVIVAEVPEAFDDAIAAGAVEAASTLAGLEEVAVSTFSVAIITEEAVAPEVVIIASATIAWVVVECFAEFRQVDQGRAGVGRSQALALTLQRDHLIHLLRSRTHHHSRLLHRSTPQDHRTTTTVAFRQHLIPKGLLVRSRHA